MRGSWGSLGAPGDLFGGPEPTSRSRVATLEGPGGGTRSLEKWSESVFFRSLEAKYTYLRGFEHADFVNLMWPLEAPARSWEDFGPPPELQSGPWEDPGGSRGKGFGPRRAPGGPENRKKMILELWSFSPKRSRPYKYSGFSVF